MTSEGVDVDPSSEGPPDQNTGPPGQGHTIEATLRQLNTNMGTMTQLLTDVCVRLPDRNIDGSSSSRSPPGTGQKRRKRCSVSPSSDESLEHQNEPRRKSRREDDCISVHASDDDVAQLLAEPPVCAATVTDKQTTMGEDELLKELVASVQEEDRKGPKVQQQLADVAFKRWGNKLNSEKMKSILGKHPQPENCEDMSIAQFRYVLTRRLVSNFIHQSEALGNKFTEIHSREVHIANISTVIVLFHEFLLFYLF